MKTAVLSITRLYTRATLVVYTYLCSDAEPMPVEESARPLILSLFFLVMCVV
jgi:hypothetical protein